MPTLFLGKSEVLPLLDMKEVIPAVEDAFCPVGAGQGPDAAQVLPDRG